MASDNDWTRKEIEDQLSSMKAITVPVNIQIQGQQRIFVLSEMEDLLKAAKLIALGECGCRKKLAKCDRPLDVCIRLDATAEEGMAKGDAKKVSLTEALETLHRSHEAGLVHIAYVFKDKPKPDLICSCCSCCCQTMSALIRFGIPYAVATSRYVAHDNTETCINCGKCVERCQFKARRMQNGKKAFTTERCFGCGLCLTTCPTQSISLTERQNKP